MKRLIDEIVKIDFKKIFSVTKREINILSKDINIITIVLIAPIFYAFFYSTIYMNKIESDVPVIIVDDDRTTTTQEIIRNLDAHQLIEIEGTTTDLSTAQKMLNDGNVQAIIYFTNNFEADLKSGKGSFVKVGLNTTRFLVSNDINKAINEVIGTINVGIRLKYFETKGYSYQQSRDMIEPVITDVRPLFNFTESYGDFLIPGMLVLILQQTLLIGLSESMAKEREKRLLQDLFQASGDSIFNSIFGKGILYLILYSVYSLFFFSVTFALLKIQFSGSVLAVILLTLLLLMSVIFLSLFLSSFFKRKIISLQVFAFSSYPIFLISGYSWPLESMPIYIKAIAMALPSTPYLNAFQRITQMGAGVNDVLPELLHLIILTLVAFLLVVYRSKSLSHNYLSNKNLFQPVLNTIKD